MEPETIVETTAAVICGLCGRGIEKAAEARCTAAWGLVHTSCYPTGRTE